MENIINLEDIFRMKKSVDDLRLKIEDSWPTPSIFHSILFAFSEMGEAIDALLDEEMLYSRNNPIPKDNVIDELADCAMMILSAVDIVGINEDYLLKKFDNPLIKNEKITTIAFHISYIALRLEDDENFQNAMYFNEHLLGIVYSISCYINRITGSNENLGDKLNERLGKIYKKHSE